MSQNHFGLPGCAVRIFPLLLLFVAAIYPASAMEFSQRGFLDTTGWFYPQTAPGDSGQAVGGELLRWEAFWKANSHWQFAGGIDARFDTHNSVERTFKLSWWDRERQRPALKVQQLSATYSAGKLTFTVGKQIVRWGRTDILTPTDRFAPRDYLNVLDNEVLPVPAARLTYGGQSNSIDLVFQPRLTPSRIPLVSQRWSVLPPDLPIDEQKPDYPGGPQYGARWNHIGSRAEYALSFYNGFDNRPLFHVALPSVQAFYPQMRMYGGDFALPTSLVTLKGEAAYFQSSNLQSDEYVLYVAQLERQTGDWFFSAGYTGQAITNHRGVLSFNPERGFTRAMTVHAGYTIDTNRSVSFDSAVRQNGRGLWANLTYSQAFGQHWRVTAGFVWIHGSDSDFLGQFHRNSHGILGIRYSF